MGDESIPRGGLPVADRRDFMCVSDMPGWVHILVGWRGRCKLDGPAAEALCEFVCEALKEVPTPQVLLNMAGVAYMNSQAVGVLAGRILKAVYQKGGELFLCNCDPWVKQLLTTLRLDRILPVLQERPETA